MKSIDYVIKTNSVSGLDERPTVNLCLGSYSQNEKGIVLITSDCISEQEIDWEADRLILAINDARKRAKQAFRRAWRRDR